MGSLTVLNANKKPFLISKLKLMGYHHLLTGKKGIKMIPKPHCDSLCLSSCNFYLCWPANSVENTQHQQTQWATLRQLWLLLRSHKLLNMIASHSILTWQCKCAIYICSTMVLNKSQSSLQSITRIKLTKCDCESILIILMVMILKKKNHLARFQN